MKFIILIVLIISSLNFSTTQKVSFKFCDGIHVYKAPSEAHCTLFHFCTPGVEFFNWSCRNGYHFSVEAKECLHPQLANCVLPCPQIDDPENPVYHPHYGDCSKYYFCSNGQPFLNQCSNGNSFDLKSNSCNPSEIVDCGIRGNGIPPIITTTQAAVTTANPSPYWCPNEQGPFFNPNPLECRNFTACFDGMHITTQCNPGYNFDYLLNDCLVDGLCYGTDPPVTSTHPPITTTTTEEPTTMTTTEETTTTELPDTSTISSTLEPTTTTHFVTTTVGTTTRIPEPFRCPPIPGIFYLPHPTNCSKYYKCNFGMAQLLVCDTGLEFDQIEKICKENANCYSSS